ncbi:MAG: sigma-70 family RNA polymerase sigma factor [Bacteroidetes bacterium]|nr:sigma-70 family RNA polymerase sigma factor [Bacteroidota bacterium]MDF1864890.1 sigma-70 family RNA polymerase sigma factor [Saprospiraceae bacterium]
MKEKEEYYLNAIISGDRTGLEEIYAQFFPRITHLITKNGGSRDDAQDVFQDAILILYEKVRKDDFKLSSNFYTLLHGICRNILGNRLQKSSFKEVTLPDDLKYTTGDDIEQDIFILEESQLFWDSFKLLGDDCQKLMTLFFDRVKMKEIMKMMGFGSESYAKKRKFQCKEKLIGFIKQDARFNELKNK